MADSGAPRSSALVLLLAEARMLLRDGRTVFTTLILPVLVLPLIFAIQGWSLEQRDERLEERRLAVAVVGDQAAFARALLAEGGEALRARSRPDAEDGGEAGGDDPGDGPGAELEEVSVQSLEEARAMLDDGRLEAVLRAGVDPEPPPPDGAPYDAAPSDEAIAADVPRFRIEFRGDRDGSSVARGALRSRLEAARALRRAAALEGVGLDAPIDRIAAVVDQRDLATAGQRTGAAYGRGAVLFLLFFLLTGGSVVAADTLAGEKERGTLETLLTSAAERRDIVLAKLGLILLVGVFITVVQILNLWVYLGLRIFEVPEDFALELSLGTALWLLALLLPLAVLVAGILLILSGRASSYKDFQSRFFPVFLLVIAPSLAAFLPGIPLRSGVALLPIASSAVGARELLAGRIDVPALLVAVLVSWAAAVFVARSALSILGTERLVTSARVDRAAFRGGSEIFPRRVLVWFAVMWVTIFLGSSLLETLHAQLFFNLVVIFLGGSLLMLRVYRLDPREALSLRAPPAAVWPAVLLGAPAAVIAMAAVGRLASRLFPLPDELLEAFARDLLPAGTPLWQLLLLIAVLPGICEEVAFRGVLQHGLRARFGPVPTVVAVGVIFGFFHLSLGRLVPTAILGVLFAVLTLWTRSLYPAIVWHALNNGCAVLAGHAGLDLMALDPVLSAAAAVVTALALAWIWRHRRPAPGERVASRRG